MPSEGHRGSSSGSSETGSESQGAGPGAGPGLPDLFMNFLLNEAANPPRSSELFKIPVGISPEWQNFFDKVAAYHERQCALNRLHVISLEKRSWVMQDKKLSELEMLVSATALKEKGNEEFRSGKVQDAMLHYVSSVSTFATPDVMNNIAACALKSNQFDVAEDFTTKALDMGFLGPRGVSKAHFRRATARLRLGKFDEAIKDVEISHALSPDDASVKDLLDRTRCAMEKSPKDLDEFLEKSNPPPKMSFPQGMHWAQEGVQYLTIPAGIQEKMLTTTMPPVF